MAESDVVVISAPLNERTVGIIGAEQLRALGPTGVLINVGRGPLIVESALYEALSARIIAGAAIDVWYKYPDSDGRGAPSELSFAELPNVLMTPHSSGVTSNTFYGPRGRHRRQHRAVGTRCAAAQPRHGQQPAACAGDAAVRRQLAIRQRHQLIPD